ncbi:MAG: RNA polymerase subunit sigma-24 [Verrucomicrobiales bacterium]|nr:RNA polymerase subunit sigma-24 [Verrucomicrobiales bacterium]|tara:strand:- start:801 stop:1475 length:675 start_codon:yes stop_codon:yes gene_type:complete
MRATDREDSDAGEALTQLCQRYWYPLYAYVRRRGQSPHDAQDLTQAFFARLLEKKLLERMDRSKGKFRTFLLSSMKHFLTDEWKRSQAQKRGGQTTILSINEESAEDRYALEPADSLSPDQLYERRRAMTILDQAMASLEPEYRSAGKAELFDGLSGSLLGAKEASYSKVGERLGQAEGAVKVAAHRLRKRFRNHLRAEGAQTVGEEADIDFELQELFNAMRGG